jgi:hypothetical protein
MKEDITTFDFSWRVDEPQHRIGSYALSTTAFANDSHRFALVDGQVDAIHSPDGSFCEVEVGAKALDFNQLIFLLRNGSFFWH